MTFRAVQDPLGLLVERINAALAGDPAPIVDDTVLDDIEALWQSVGDRVDVAVVQVSGWVHWLRFQAAGAAHGSDPGANAELFAAMRYFDIIVDAAPEAVPPPSMGLSAPEGPGFRRDARGEPVPPRPNDG